MENIDFEKVLTNIMKGNTQEGDSSIPAGETPKATLTYYTRRELRPVATLPYLHLQDP